jgi:sugar phosphate permease
MNEKKVDWMKSKLNLSNNSSPSPYRWLILAIATFAQASATLVTYGVGPLAAVWQKQWQLNATQTGLLVSAVQIGPLLSMLFIGYAMDRYGERWLISLGSILLGISFLLTAFALQYFILLFLLTLVGIWYGTAQPGGSKVILKWFSKEERGLAMGIRQAGIPIGGALAGIILPFLSLRFDWKTAVYVQSGIAVIGGILFFLFYRDTGQKESPVSSQSTFKQKMKQILNVKEVISILFTGVVLVSLQMVIVGHLMLFFIREIKISLTMSGQLFSTALGFGMLGRIVLAYISDRYWGGNRIAPLQLSIWASVVGLLILIFAPSTLPMWFYFGICAWLGFFGIGWFSSYLLAVAERAPSGSEGLMVSYALTLNQMAIVLSPILFGLVVDLYSYALASIGLMGLLIFNGLWLIIHSSGSHEVREQKGEDCHVN